MAGTVPHPEKSGQVWVRTPAEGGRGKPAKQRPPQDLCPEVWNPAYPDAWNNLGLLYRDMGQFDRSIGAFEKGMALDRSQAFAPFNLAVTYFRLGDRERARQLFTETQQRFPSLAPKIAPYLASMQ
jgi:tetratricopeptide (TPR) repeat protein